MSQPDIILYTANTMNGWKPLIFLHEGEIGYDMVPISFAKLIDDHGGIIEFDTGSEGTEFRVFLPVDTSSNSDRGDK